MVMKFFVEYFLNKSLIVVGISMCFVKKKKKKISGVGYDF